MPIDQHQLTRLSATFDSYKFTFDGVEAWSARDLQGLLGYSLWQNFRHAIQRATDSCRTAGRDPTRHFVPMIGKLNISRDRAFIGVNKSLKGTKGGSLREDMILSRFGAYLVAINGDPSKEEIAFAQAYFIIQTRKTEVLEQRLGEMERLAQREQLARIESSLGFVLLAHGVPRPGFAYIRSVGDEALFGGFTTKAMKQRLKCPANTPLANYLQTVLIWGKGFAASMTEHNTKAMNMWGTLRISKEHENNNLNVRRAMLDSNIIPENLLPAEDTKKLEKRLVKEKRIMIATAEELPMTGKTKD